MALGTWLPAVLVLNWFSDQKGLWFLTGVQISRPADAPMSRDHTLLVNMEPVPVGELVCCDGHGPTTRRVRLLRTCRGSPEPFTNSCSKVFGDVPKVSERVKVSELEQIKVAADQTPPFRPHRSTNPAKFWKLKLGSSFDPEGNFPTFSASLAQNQAANTHLPTPYFSFLVATQGFMAGGGGEADGAAINKYIYNNTPARGRAADPARPGT